MTGYDDPGWGPALRRTPFIVLVPFANVRTMSSGAKRGLDGLTLMRILFLSFVAALLLFLVVLILIDSRAGPPTIPTWAPVAFAGVLLMSVGGAVWARARPLDVTDEPSLAGSYRTTFFLGVAFAESAALAGFVGVFLVGSLLPYLVGLAVSLLGFAVIAPSRSNIERRQHEVTARGSSLSLGKAVMTALPPAPR